jgi:hypothetical protein
MGKGTFLGNAHATRLNPVIVAPDELLAELQGKEQTQLPNPTVGSWFLRRLSVPKLIGVDDCRVNAPRLGLQIRRG